MPLVDRGFTEPATDSIGWSGVADVARTFDQLHALIVSHKGSVALAEAFRGPPVDRSVNVKSVSKTIVAALVGTAIDRGEIKGVEQSLGDLEPELIHPTELRSMSEIWKTSGMDDNCLRLLADFP